MRGTGGGPATPIALTSLEEKLLGFIGEEKVFGIDGVPELGMGNETVYAREYLYTHVYLVSMYTNIIIALIYRTHLQNWKCTAQTHWSLWQMSPSNLNT
jgi:hypothetical protein